MDEKIECMKKLIRRIDFRMQVLKNKRKSITQDMMIEIIKLEYLIGNPTR